MNRCMAAYTQGRDLKQISAASACTRDVQTCKPSDTLAYAEDLMARHQIRRLPVVDDQGGLVGLISLSDLARHMKFVALGKSNSLGPRNLGLVFESVSRARKPQADANEPAQLQAQASS